MRIPYWKNIIGLNFLQTSFSSTRIFWLFLSKNNANFKRIYGPSLSFSFRVSFSSFCYFIIIFFSDYFWIERNYFKTTSVYRGIGKTIEKRKSIVLEMQRIIDSCYVTIDYFRTIFGFVINWSGSYRNSNSKTYEYLKKVFLYRLFQRFKVKMQ